VDAKKMEAQFTGPSKEQMEALMSKLEANADEPITIRGNDARMAYGEHYEVKFVKEDGIWKLKDSTNSGGYSRSHRCGDLPTCKPCHTPFLSPSLRKKSEYGHQAQRATVLMKVDGGVR